METSPTAPLAFDKELADKVTALGRTNEVRLTPSHAAPKIFPDLCTATGIFPNFPEVKAWPIP